MYSTHHGGWASGLRFKNALINPIGFTGGSNTGRASALDVCAMRRVTARGNFCSGPIKSDQRHCRRVLVHVVSAFRGDWDGVCSARVKESLEGVGWLFVGDMVLWAVRGSLMYEPGFSGIGLCGAVSYHWIDRSVEVLDGAGLLCH